MDEQTSPQLKLKVPEFMSYEVGCEFPTPPQIYHSQQKRPNDHSFDRPVSATQQQQSILRGKAPIVPAVQRFKSINYQEPHRKPGVSTESTKLKQHSSMLVRAPVPVNKKKPLNQQQKLPEIRQSQRSPSRQGKEDSKVFSFNSQDEHIRRFLVRHRWIENASNSTVFDLKWSYTDNVDEFNSLVEGQYYNHFKNSRELTSKNGLLMNFKNCGEYGLNPFAYFPRAYDLGNAAERDDFLIEYERTTYFIVLKKHISYFKRRRPKLFQALRADLQSEADAKRVRRKVDDKRLILSRELHRKFKRIYKPEQCAMEKDEKDFKVNLPLLCEMLSRFSDWKHMISAFIEDPEVEVPCRIAQRIRECVHNYSLLEANYDRSDLSQRQKTVLQANHTYQTPNRRIVKKLIKYHYFFKSHEASYKNDGVENIWIVKPSGNARGQGIYLEKNIDEAIDQGKGMQARIIQKYIEKPLIFTSSEKQYKPISGKKFDIRQWVLVRSFTPLRVYMFSHSYMRMCSHPFDLKDYRNPYKHLTNYSLNKNNFDCSAESVYSSDVLADLLSKCKKPSWELQVKPQIKSLIVDSLRCMQEQFENEPKNCFEMFGFDILLDKQCKPWLLEVNLSPACSERVSWLTEMLNYMAEGMFRLVLPASYYDANEFLPGSEKYKWECLVFEDQLPAQPKLNFELLVQGMKINPKREGRLDRQHNRFIATLVLQKFARMFLAKNQLTLLRKTKYAIVIQKYARRYLAVKLRRHLKRIKCSIALQCAARCFISRRRLLLLKKIASAIKIQCAYRMKYSRKVRDFLVTERSALLIQSCVRARKAFKAYLERKHYYNSVLKLQRAWKRKYLELNRKAVMIQKNIRWYMVTGILVISR